jgi:alkaline phosphatase
MFNHLIISLMKKRSNLSAVRLVLIGLAITGVLDSCKTDHGKGGPSKPKNIILMIGDGMGVTQVYAGLTANGGHLNLESCTYVGFQKTHSASSYTTDSGAAATSIATGKKTRNGAIAVDTSGQRLKTILEMAEEAGLSTGLVATSTITHATPASFVAHNPDRGKYEEIAMDFIGAGLEVIIGGGRNHFNRREDNRDLLKDLRADGYQVTERIDQVDPDHPGAIAVFTDSLAMPPAMKGRGDLLPGATELALGRLAENEKGFFLMVEASQIDWAGHDNDTEYLVSEMIDFDNAIGKALEFARKNPETLVIITADHETGAMAIERGNMKTGDVVGLYSSEGHTGVMVPVFAYGPGSESFAGIYENTDIFEKMAGLMELD